MTLFVYPLQFQLPLNVVNVVTAIAVVCFHYFVYFAGYAMWPAVVLDESLASNCKGLKTLLGGRSVPVQFFGTHDFARFNILLIEKLFSMCSVFVYTIDSFLFVR